MAVNRLSLFPTYAYGPRYSRPVQNTVSAFYLPQTEFTPRYPVNVTPDNSVFASDSYFQLNAQSGTLSSVPVSTASNFNNFLAVSGNPTEPLTAVSLPQSTPETPQTYQDRLSSYAINDDNQSSLMAESSFRISRPGMGYLVTTDGLGGVDSIRLSPTSRGSTLGASATDASQFLFGNRQNMLSIFSPQPTANAPVFSANKLAGPSPQPLTNSLAELSPLLPATGILPKPNPSLFGGLTNTAKNPVLERLYQLQPPQEGLAVSGFNSALNNTTSQQLAAQRAGFNLQAAPEFRDALTSLQEAAFYKSQKTIPTGIQASDVARAVEKYIPMAPSLPIPKSQSGSLSLATTLEYFQETVSAGVLDSASKKGGSGMAYVGTQVGGQGGGQTGGFGTGMGFGGGFGSLLGGGTDSGNTGNGSTSGNHGNPRYPHQPLRLMA